MWYLVVKIDNESLVVSDHRNQPREFPKFSKLNNFINGRPHLDKYPTEATENIEAIPGRFKVSP